jgi:hypothetical protein
MTKDAAKCKYGDALCPCQDGDMCHYEGQNPMKPPVEFERCTVCGDIHEGEVPRECETGDGT